MARRTRPTHGPLDPRAEAILRAVIEEYVATAAPVGSLALVERYGLGVSSATVRNVLAELEAAGLVSQPHTSAGRVPTDAGYRYYVESLAEEFRLPAVEELMIRHQFGQVEYASEQWFRLAAHTLAAATRAAGLATPAKPRAARVRRVDLVGIQERLASLIVVLHGGTIKQRLVALPDAFDQAALSVVAAIVDEATVGRTAREIEGWLTRFDDPTPAGRLARTVGERIVAVLREFDAAAIEEIFSEGLLNVMEAPEFARSETLRRVFSALENRAYLGELVDRVAASGDVQVFIGRENPPAELRDVSLVLAPYGRPGEAIGVVGVLGPTRMPYPVAIGTVRFVSGLMNELVEHLYD
ncbi:MAG TPA: heat-inducible transcriptional repressor HrcA [Candidatus Limnocylindrales bacterium]|nr:heat-inducible transcriptional repressor HrcA [Candidatus Limnocylindrales bacterium]